MSKKKKYYVVWQGYKTGIFEDWTSCQSAVKGYSGAIFKSYPSRQEAEEVIELYKYNPELALLEEKKTSSTTSPICLAYNPSPRPTIGIAVDGACSGNPGLAEYRGVRIEDGVQLFSISPIMATNNIVEFLAIVHALAMCQREGVTDTTIYSDSLNAIQWVKMGKCRTKIPQEARFLRAFELIERAEVWLSKHPYEERLPVVKWNTESWGEIPADFGRK